MHTPSPTNELNLTSKRAKIAAVNTHLIAGAGILFTGLNNLDFPEHKTMAIAEMAVGGLLLLALLLEKISPHAHVEKFDWILDLLAGSVAVVEGVSKMHGHFRAIVGTYWLVALMFFALAYFRPRLKKLRYARFEAKHIAIKTHPFKSEQVIAWKDIAALEVNGKIVVRTKAGTEFKIDLNDQDHPAEVKKVFLEEMGKHGIKPSGTAQEKKEPDHKRTT